MTASSEFWSEADQAAHAVVEVLIRHRDAQKDAQKRNRKPSDHPPIRETAKELSAALAYYEKVMASYEKVVK